MRTALTVVVKKWKAEAKVGRRLVCTVWPSTLHANFRLRIELEACGIKVAVCNLKVCCYSKKIFVYFHYVLECSNKLF